MSDQLVAGTVMLNGANGEKKFLVKKENNQFDFLTTRIGTDITSLASILQVLKNEVYVDVNIIELVELTNVYAESKKMPLYVFEMEEKQDLDLINDNYVWETPNTLRSVLNKFQVLGVPIFE